jgi:hypothetical protein
LAEAAGRFQSASAKVLIDFVAAPTKRGLCSDPGSQSDEAAAAE